MDTSIRGDQPFTLENDEKLYYLICNGEIYNYKELCEKYEIDTHSGSDCEMLLPLWRKIGMDAMVKELNGEYAFVICEITKSTKEVTLHISRDHVGVRPLYITGNENEVVLTSELKGSPFLFRDFEYKIQQYKPRHYATVSNLDENLYNLKYTEYINFADVETTIYDLEEANTKIRQAFKNSVKRRLMSDRGISAALSGGVDSSAVAEELSKLCKENGKILKTFSIGLSGGSTDEKYAKIAATAIGSDHTHFYVTKEECLETASMITSITQNFDVTTNRATVFQHLLMKHIRASVGEKVVFLGDGSDEATNGYIYNLACPDAESLHLEALKLVNNIHYFDVTRADRGTSSNGLEARVPYLDKEFIITYLSVDPKLRMPYNGLEKWLLRESLKSDNLLPLEIIFRKKEALSDATSSLEDSWYLTLQKYIDTLISDEEYETEKVKYTYLPPHSKEAYYFRKQFEKYLGTSEEAAKTVPYYWLPNQEWCGNITEASARALEIHKKHFGNK
jgi:asparagine synthase (glutamine-hydrolysing)